MDETQSYTVQFAKKVNGKTHWPIIGRAFHAEKRVEIRLDAMPIGEWDGRLFLYPMKSKDLARESAMDAYEGSHEAAIYNARGAAEQD